MPHTLTCLVIHVVFSTKNRVPLLDENIRKRIFAYLQAVLERNDAKVHIVGGDRRSRSHSDDRASLPVYL